MNKTKIIVVEDKHRVLRICLQYAVTGGLPQYEGLPPLNREETSATGNR